MTDDDFTTRDTIEIKRYLKGSANAEDWRQVRRVCEKLGLSEQDEFAIARIVAKARTRGRLEERRELGLPTDHLYDTVVRMKDAQ